MEVANTRKRRHATFPAAVSAVLVVGAVTCAAVDAQEKRTGEPTPSPPGAAVYFVNIKDGATVPTRVTIHFGLRGMGVAPAGSARANSGHHHLLIDTDLPPLDQPIPNDFNHLHFGAGQTEAEVTLTPGPHTLQLLLGDEAQVLKAECTCALFRKQGLKQGPCAHLIALRLSYAEQQRGKPGTQSQLLEGVHARGFRRKEFTLCASNQQLSQNRPGRIAG